MRFRHQGRRHRPRAANCPRRVVAATWNGGPDCPSLAHRDVSRLAGFFHSAHAPAIDGLVQPRWFWGRKCGQYEWWCVCLSKNRVNSFSVPIICLRKSQCRFAAGASCATSTIATSSAGWPTPAARRTSRTTCDTPGFHAFRAAARALGGMVDFRVLSDHEAASRPASEAGASDASRRNDQVQSLKPRSSLTRVFSR